MALKFQAIARGNAQSYPVTYDVNFTGIPKTGEITEQREKLERMIKADKKAQEKEGAARVFRIVFDWVKLKNDPIIYQLKVALPRDKRFKKPPVVRNGGPGEVQPTPKNSIPPA